MDFTAPTADQVLAIRINAGIEELASHERFAAATSDMVDAIVEGIGEQLSPVQTPESWLVLVHPGVSVPTPVIFRDPELTRDSKPVKMSDFSNRLPGFGKNDLQAVAARAFPPVADALQWLSHHGEARMTGSGACVFAAFATESEADAALSDLPPEWRGWKTRTLDAHPLASLLPS